jgi:hypothetical protein
MSLSEKIHQLNREIGDSVEHALAELRREISQRLHASNEEIQKRLEDFSPSLPTSYLSHEELTSSAERELAPSARRGALGDLRDALSRLDRARSQAEILTVLLRESARHASRAALLLVRGEGLQGWGSEGFGDAGATALRALVLDAPNGAWGGLGTAQSAVRLSAAECAVLCSRIESPLPHDGVLVPIVLRDHVAAVLYADRLEDGPENGPENSDLAVEALQILAYSAAQGIETLPFRERATTATLSLDGQEVGNGAPAAAPAPAEPAPAPAAEAWPAAAPEPEPEPEPAPAQESAAAEPPPSPAEPPAEMPAWSARSVEPAIPHVTEAMPLPGFPVRPGSSFSPLPPAAASSPLSTPRDAGPADDEGAAAAAAAPEEEDAMAEEVPRYPRSVAAEPAPPAQPDFSPNATVLLSRSGLSGAEPEAPPAPPAAAPLRPVPAPDDQPPPAPPATFDRGGAGGASGTPEVRPPSDIEGPGWAFAATTRMPVTAAPNNESMHEEARRLARLLVSEIKLYNEDQVEEGRRNRDIYERLKEDIDRSRQMYDERVDPQILRSTDYFYQELVRILAAGDSKALGI